MKNERKVTYVLSNSRRSSLPCRRFLPTMNRYNVRTRHPLACKVLRSPIRSNEPHMSLGMRALNVQPLDLPIAVLPRSMDLQHPLCFASSCARLRYLQRWKYFFTLSRKHNLKLNPVVWEVDSCQCQRTNLMRWD